ncbi:hypothetical protein LOTGIDRAFT_157686 [Lottia gigantea]|uniref:Uncharacterized protein n=1 Tax=Lottia gigantea TaxID=225164 RepID=V4A942_LOTGI|nr:hypothetical protein LOTGIDRAFT_157686 [Lottia gigantea]ESP00479.1 hypothetical protein LOTGIDRAFT_157686 [Lottia gigantea]
MMNLTVVTSLLVMVAISLQSVEAAGRRCWCDARINGKIVKSFGNNGVISSCGWLCGCRNSNMLQCDLKCDETVQHWAENICIQGYRGQKVRAHYKASTCDTGYGRRTFTCTPPKVCYKKVTKRVPYTCYRTVTQTVTTPCNKGSSGSSGGINGIHKGALQL